MRQAIGLAVGLTMMAAPQLWAGSKAHGHGGSGHHGGGHSGHGRGGGHSAHSSGAHSGHGGSGHRGSLHVDVTHGGGHRGHSGLGISLFGSRHGHSRSHVYGYWPYAYGYYGGYSSPYYYGAPYYSGGEPYGYGYSGSYGRGSGEGAIRVLVEPAETAVYVDGYYAGTAEDFDGAFQRLHLDAGRHEIALSLAGFRRARFEVYVTPDHTVKLHHRMTTGSGYDDVSRLGELPADDGELGRPANYADDDAGRSQVGTLRLEIGPADAAVYVDGEFRGTAGQARRLDLPAGAHRIEIVRPGLRTVVRDVQIRARATAGVEADLVP